MTADTPRQAEPDPEKFEEEVREFVRELEEASNAPWTEEDQAMFDSLPELPPLPTEQGQVVAVFISRRPTSPRPPRHKK